MTREQLKQLIKLSIAEVIRELLSAGQEAAVTSREPVKDRPLKAGMGWCAHCGKEVPKASLRYQGEHDHSEEADQFEAANKARKCEKCGSELEPGQKKYCSDCSPKDDKKNKPQRGGIRENEPARRKEPVPINHPPLTSIRKGEWTHKSGKWEKTDKHPDSKKTK